MASFNRSTGTARHRLTGSGAMRGSGQALIRDSGDSRAGRANRFRADTLSNEPSCRRSFGVVVQEHDRPAAQVRERGEEFLQVVILRLRRVTLLGAIETIEIEQIDRVEKPSGRSESLTDIVMRASNAAVAPARSRSPARRCRRSRDAAVPIGKLAEEVRAQPSPYQFPGSRNEPVSTMCRPPCWRKRFSAT